jgi:hypothetical protein
MEKNFTLQDLQNYLQETHFLGQTAPKKGYRSVGPSNLTIQNILRYSSALNVLRTNSAGTVYQLAN